MASSNKETSSAAGQRSNDHFVLDFLYHDSRRVGSYLSQFEEFGTLKEVTQTKGRSRNEAERSTLSGTVGVPGVIGGKADDVTEVASSAQDNSARAYDPFWRNARAFLDYAEDAELLHDDIQTTPLGGFVHVVGKLFMAHLDLMSAVWNLPSIQRNLRAGAGLPADPPQGNRQQRRKQSRTGNAEADNAPSEMEMALEVLPKMPHKGQLMMLAGTTAIWATIAEGSLVGLASDLTLKHGARIAGEWHMVGIKDASPDIGATGPTDEELVALGLLHGSALITAASVNLAAIVRPSLGRPQGSYGVTPLLIFRSVGR